MRQWVTWWLRDSVPELRDWVYEWQRECLKNG